MLVCVCVCVCANARVCVREGMRPAALFRKIIQNELLKVESVPDLSGKVSIWFLKYTD